MIFVYLTFLFLLLPDLAFAWGPGTHLEIAVTVLQNGAWLLPAIRKLIQDHPNEYIYGNVAPDIIVAKKLAGPLHHCHNWSIGKLILEEAKTDAERAAAWGYLTHLAADCVAHNYFVPYKIIQSYQKRSLGHIYWEMRYDTLVPEDIWKELGHVVRQNYRPFDHLLERVLKRTLFSFKTSRRIFNSILVLHRMQKLRSGLRSYAQQSKWLMHDEEVHGFRFIAMETVRDFLKNPEKAKCLNADPAGLRKLVYAAEMDKKLRRLLRMGRVDSKELDAFVNKVDEKLKKTMFDSSFELPAVDELLLR